LEVIICDSEASVASLVATHVCELVRARPSAVLGLPTGRSPIATYNKIIHLSTQGGISLAGVRVFMLDEFLGIDEDHPGRFFNYLRRFTGDMGIPETSIFALPHAWPEGEEPDSALARDCEAYEAAIRDAGGIDLQLLGISPRGHIGFNEPTSSLSSRTRVKTLTAETREDSVFDFAAIEVDAAGGIQMSVDPERVPPHVITQGIATILESRHAILIATGDSKAGVIKQVVEGPLTAFVPGSALQLHPHATIVLDEAAAQALTMESYYREVQHNKRYIQRPIT
jgi:glucosamine-6-phosphate deaminase